ncbi:osmotically inducible protein C [Hydrogenophaga crassostreae]|uniref:Osmotically inducible protein C n=1 Tax=Hydrogenophaga crassostreae TaxID=1763535 RepID=A0ABX2U7X1_9BURK|nr:alpha/beta fold hydrolase [Hydrogenophaga crassostreae]OAD41833.1 osmotically inducible protein C [Hydrogenophaga crassostreae]
MPSERIEFPGSLGETLAGRLDTPDNAPHAWAVFAHCFTCSKDSKAAAFIARALSEAGFGVLRFDFTGLGGSGGDFANTHFSSNVDDLLAAAAWLRTHHGAPSLLIGHSLGGAAVLAAARRVDDCRAVVTVGAPFEPGHVTHQLDGESLQVIEKEGEASVSLAGRQFTIRREFVQDLAGQPQADRIRGLAKPLLILHAPLDQTVGVDNARRIFETAVHPKSFVALDGADHLLNNAQDAQFAASLIAAWSRRYLPSEVPQPARLPESESTSTVAGEGVVVVSERGTGRFTQVVSAGQHQFLMDEPAAAGGDDEGPTPYDMLNAALGACTAMTVRMYARRKRWPLASVRVALVHDKVHATDCEDCENRDGKVDQIVRVVELQGDLDEAQRARLIEIADRCPVHQTLHAEVRILTRQGKL